MDEQLVARLEKVAELIDAAVLEKKADALSKEFYDDCQEAIAILSEAMPYLPKALRKRTEAWINQFAVYVAGY